MRFTLSLALFTVLSSSFAQSACDSVTTELDRTYQNHGVMFNVVAYNPITIDHLTANISWNVANFDLYYKVGGFQGYEGIPGAWTSLGAATVSSNNTQLTDDIPTVIPIPIDLELQPGDTVAFYLTATPLSKVFLIATTTPWGTYQYTDANMGVSIARSIFNLFGVPFSTPQIWSGRVAYCEGISTGITGPVAAAADIRMVGDMLQLTIDAPQGTASELVLYDGEGRAVLNRKLNASLTTLDVSNLGHGIYVAVVRGPQGTTAAQRVVLF
jgi:hypothetical protein